MQMMTIKFKQAQHPGRPLWKVIESDSTACSPPLWLGNLNAAESIQIPINYFKIFIDLTLINHIVDQSNLCAAQVNLASPLELSCDAFDKFLAVVCLMSIVALPHLRLYWLLDLAVCQVKNILSRKQFEQIKQFVHFNDNTTEMLSPTDANFDQLFKVKPLLDHLQKKFNLVPMSQMMCVDEMMIPFKENSLLKQYIPSKPHKYGYKVFVLCNNSGITHDFEVYSGKVEPPTNIDLGASSNLVLRLSKTIPVGKNHLLFFDNWCTSLFLMNFLAKSAIYCLDTVKRNQLSGINFPPDKKMKDDGQGSHVEKECVVDNTIIRAVKWFDNNGVSLLTTFDSVHPLCDVSRYDQKNKIRISIPCPKMVCTYNKCMGGVNLLDSLIGLYRTKIRSKKYYYRIFYHFLDVTVVTSWLLYERDCKDFCVPKCKQLTLLQFKHCIAESLSERASLSQL